MPELVDTVMSLNEGLLADLVGDYRIIALLDELDSSRRFNIQERAELVVEFLGANALLLDRPKCNTLMEHFPMPILMVCEQLGIGHNKIYDFHRTLARKQALFSFFNRTYSEHEVDEEIPECSMCDEERIPKWSPSDAPYYALFKHQRVALDEVLSALAGDPPRVLLHMPTGSGKTRTAMHAICRALFANEDRTVLWLAAGRELCDQAADEFEKAWSFLGNRPMEVTRFYGEHDVETLPTSETGGGFAVASLQKLHLRKAQAPEALVGFARSLDLIVFDEAHQAVARTYAELTEFLLQMNRSTGLLGLSATPGRAHVDGSVEADEGLVAMFEGNKVRLEAEGHPNVIRFLEEEGYLSRLTWDTIDIRDEAALSNFNLEDAFDIPTEVLKRLGLSVQRNLALIETVEDLIDQGHKRIILFAASVEGARLLSLIFKHLGHQAYSVDAGTPPSVRAQAIGRFRSEDEDPIVLCNYGVLTTGFDAPQTSAVVIARPTTSVVLYSQMVGRAIRGIHVGGTAEAHVVNVHDTGIDVFRDVARQFLRWEDSWSD